MRPSFDPDPVFDVPAAAITARFGTAHLVDGERPTVPDAPRAALDEAFFEAGEQGAYEGGPRELTEDFAEECEAEVVVRTIPPEQARRRRSATRVVAVAMGFFGVLSVVALGRFVVTELGARGADPEASVAAAPMALAIPRAAEDSAPAAIELAAPARPAAPAAAEQEPASLPHAVASKSASRLAAPRAAPNAVAAPAEPELAPPIAAPAGPVPTARFELLP